MKRTSHILLALSLLPVLSCAGGSKKEAMKEDKPSAKAPEVVPGQLMIAFQEKISENEAKALFKKYDLKHLQKLGSANLYLVEVPATSTIKEMQEKLKKEPTIRYSEPNSVMKTF